MVSKVMTNLCRARISSGVGLNDFIGVFRQTVDCICGRRKHLSYKTTCVCVVCHVGVMEGNLNDECLMLLIMMRQVNFAKRTLQPRNYDCLYLLQTSLCLTNYKTFTQQPCTSLNCLISAHQPLSSSEAEIPQPSFDI